MEQYIVNSGREESKGGEDAQMDNAYVTFSPNE